MQPIDGGETAELRRFTAAAVTAMNKVSRVPYAAKSYSMISGA